MVMAKQQQHDKGSPKQARNEPAPFRLEHCCDCDDARRLADDGSKGAGPAGPLHLTLGPLGSAADRRRCSCGVAPAPAAPVTVAVLRGSRYLRPAQELLCEVVRVADLAAGEDEDEDQVTERLEGGGSHRSVRRVAGNDGDGDGDGVQAKLLGLLSELESRRERYFGELGRVVSSFEPALGDGAAAAYTSLMARAMARHFGNLRRVILRRLRLHAVAAARRSLRRGGEEHHDDDDDEVTEELVERVARRTKLAAAARAEQASWRPLRGLPDGSVAVLRAWLFDHFLHPYPDDGEKLRLAVTTGLSRRQISNWFINARVRLWKPMIEEMYKDEFSEGSAVSRDDDASASSSS
ncbi:unnamed protein product [Miscanthus lutarioriparius]|uniref:Homeobox domain-containing protein n=1 Tax=Miscanthus lutarioriparius TaxID=422564 RepID=A0A811N305_9POAL|nr:unnamed protein product [Miscanthus lutarioriparius]